MTALLGLVALSVVLTFLIARGNLDGGPWSDCLPGLRRFWSGR